MPIDVKDISERETSSSLPAEVKSQEAERPTETISALDTATLEPVSQIKKDYAAELTVEDARKSCPIVIPEHAASNHGEVRFTHLNTSDLDYNRVTFTWKEGRMNYSAALHSKGLGDGPDGPKWVISKRRNHNVHYVTRNDEGLAWKSSLDVGRPSKLINAAYRDGDAATIKESLRKLGSIEVEPRAHDEQEDSPVQLGSLPSLPPQKASQSKKNTINEASEKAPSSCSQYAKLFARLKPEDVRGTAPLPIPDDAKVTSRKKNHGNILVNNQFRQIEFYWEDDGKHYRARWHTPTCKKVLSKGNNWRVSRHVPHGEKEELVELEGKLEWLDKEVFKALSDVQGKQKMTVLKKSEIRDTSQKNITIAKGLARDILAAAHFFEQETAERIKTTVGVAT